MLVPDPFLALLFPAGDGCTSPAHASHRVIVLPTCTLTLLRYNNPDVIEANLQPTAHALYTNTTGQRKFLRRTYVRIRGKAIADCCLIQIDHLFLYLPAHAKPR